MIKDSAGMVPRKYEAVESAVDQATEKMKSRRKKLQ